MCEYVSVRVCECVREFESVRERESVCNSVRVRMCEGERECECMYERECVSDYVCESV